MPGLEVHRRLRLVLWGLLLVATTVLSLIGEFTLIGWGERTAYTLFNPSPADAAWDVVGAWAFGIAGLVAMHRRPGSRVGGLMVLIGVTLLTGGWMFLPLPALVSFGHWSSHAPIILLGILVLGYPSGRIPARLDRTWVALALVYLFGIQLALTLVTPIGQWDCPECHSLITLSYDVHVEATVYHLTVWALLLLAPTLLLLLIRRWRGATPTARRLLAPVWLAGFAFTSVALTYTVVGNAGPSLDPMSQLQSPGRLLRVQVPPVVWEVMPWLTRGSLVLMPIAFLWGLMQAQMGRAAVSALAVELGHARRRVPLVESLRRALADRSLELGLWSRPAGAYVTPDGAPLRLPEQVAGRTVTRLDGENGPLAVMIHDPAVADQQDLIDGVVAVAQLALENERLHAEVKAQLEEVRASRARIVTAADEERRRVERNIHDGAQQRLVGLSLALALAQAKAADASPDVAASLAAAEAELKRAITDLRELARGIHPAILTEAGLGPALESLAEHSPVPVAVDSTLDGMRLPPLVEATAYFVAAEALTNVTKHASATRVTLMAAVTDDWLRLRIADDGVGGANPADGSGLRGLIDRVAALGGRLRIEDAGASGGTRLEADIPCG